MSRRSRESTRGRSREVETPGASGTPAIEYREQMRVPPWWYLVALGVASILAAEFHVSGLRLTDWIPWGVLLPLSVVIVWTFSRSTLTITGGELRVHGAHLPLSYISGVVALDERTLRRVVGREGDPAAFLCIRAWVGPGVQLWLDDPEDPTPYWVLSTRHPEQVVALLRGAIG